MRAKPGVVEALNRILTIEMTAVNQYFLQSEIIRNWGYDHLADRLAASTDAMAVEAAAVFERKSGRKAHWHLTGQCRTFRAASRRRQPFR